MSGKIDLDALSKELREEGFDVGQIIAALSIIWRHVAPAPAAPDAGLRMKIIKALDKHFASGKTITPSTTADAILALLPPRIDGVTIPRELAERAVVAFREQYEYGDRYRGDEPDEVIERPLADADQLRALLGDGREGVGE